MTAAAGATGVRTWLQARGWTWLTPKRLRRVTIAAFIAAALVASIGINGSTHPTPGHPAASANPTR